MRTHTNFSCVFTFPFSYFYHINRAQIWYDTTMTNQRIRRFFAQAFLVIAYLLVTLQWLWVFAVGLPPLIDAGMLDTFIPTEPVETKSVTHPVELSPVIAIVAGAVTLLFLALTIVVLIKLPKTISTTGDKIVQQSTNALIPVITHHKKLPAKKKRLISRRIRKGIQVLLLALPLAISFLIPPAQTITSQMIITLATWLACFSSISFIFSWLFEPNPTSRTQSRASRESH